jgi:hypothetical protein
VSGVIVSVPPSGLPANGRLAVICETIRQLRMDGGRRAFSIADVPADLPIDFNCPHGRSARRE